MSIAQSVKHQDRLLTINIKDGEIKMHYRCACHTLLLDPDNGVWVIHARFERVLSFHVTSIPVLYISIQLLVHGIMLNILKMFKLR